MQFSMMSCENFYLQSEHIPSKWKNTRSNMQVLTKIKNHTIIDINRKEQKTKAYV